MKRVKLIDFNKLPKVIKKEIVSDIEAMVDDTLTHLSFNLDFLNWDVDIEGETFKIRDKDIDKLSRKILKSYL